MENLKREDHERPTQKVENIKRDFQDTGWEDKALDRFPEQLSAS